MQQQVSTTFHIPKIINLIRARKLTQININFINSQEQT